MSDAIAGSIRSQTEAGGGLSVTEKLAIVAVVGLACQSCAIVLSSGFFGGETEGEAMLAAGCSGAACSGATRSAKSAGVVMEEAASAAAGGGVRANAARGMAFEAKVAAEMEANGWAVAREVTLETSGGARTRMDIVGTRAGSVRCVECKSSASAPLTPGQKAAHPQIESHGATVMGRGKPSVPGGTQIPPTPVEIRRP